MPIATQETDKVRLARQSLGASVSCVRDDGGLQHRVVVIQDLAADFAESWLINVSCKEFNPEAQKWSHFQSYIHPYGVSCHAGLAWSSADPWLFASVSYDGRVAVNRVPGNVKYSILI